MEPHITLVKKDSKSWIAFLILGTIFISIGCYSLFHPFTKKISLSHVFGMLALLTGVVKVIFSNKNTQESPYRKMNTVIGIFDILIGVFLLFFQGIFSFIFSLILSYWILSGGIMIFDETTDLKLFHTSPTDWMIVGGMLTVVSFVAIGYLPFLGSLTAMFSTIISLFIIGLFHILLSWRLKSISKKLRNKGKGLSSAQKRYVA
jgi:uncharacterized membrane protein HdeD (DUF308 family)